MQSTPIRYSKSREVSFSGEGITYRDENNTEVFIDFGACRANWVSYVNNSNEFESRNISENDTKCVALRDICGNPPYIEFFSEPRTRFVFLLSRLDQLFRRGKVNREFLEMQDAIRKAGWSSFDNS